MFFRHPLTISIEKGVAPDGRSSCQDTISGHSGINRGATFTSGAVGGAMEFNGSNYVEVPDTADLDPRLGDYSMEAWIKIPVGSKGQRRAIAHGSHGNGGFDGLSLVEWCAWGNVPCGGVGLLLGVDGAGERLVGTCQAMDDGQFHHYAGVIKRGESMQLYVDGALLTSP